VAMPAPSSKNYQVNGFHHIRFSSSLALSASPFALSDANTVTTSSPCFLYNPCSRNTFS